MSEEMRTFSLRDVRGQIPKAYIRRHAINLVIFLKMFLSSLLYK